MADIQWLLARKTREFKPNLKFHISISRQQRLSLKVVPRALTIMVATKKISVGQYTKLLQTVSPTRAAS